MQQEWDVTVREARNGHFMFERGYMEYHSHRFEDASLLLTEGQRIAGLFVGNRDGDRIIGHGGLTFGGLVMARQTRFRQTVEALDAVMEFYRCQGVQEMRLKPLPWIYYREPSDDILLTMHRRGARLSRRDLSSAIGLPRPVLARGRRSDIVRAKREAIRLGPSDRLEEFLLIAEAATRERHGAQITHTAEEMRILMERFPDHILLHAAEDNEGRLLAGVLLYVTPQVAHTQYIAYSQAGRRTRATDLLLVSVMETSFGTHPYFDFGISNQGSGGRLNKGLLSYKEGFGARPVCYDQYEINLHSQAPQDSGNGIVGGW